MLDQFAFDALVAKEGDEAVFWSLSDLNYLGTIKKEGRRTFLQELFSKDPSDFSTKLEQLYRMLINLEDFKISL